jgi:hypothetical protein
MLLTRENGVINVFADAYRLEVAKDRPFVYLYDRNGLRLAELFAPGAVHSCSGQDDVTRLDAWRVEEGLDGVILNLETASAAWEKKITRFTCSPRRLKVEMVVSGAGKLLDVEYFSGYCSAQPRWGSGFFLSGQHFTQVFNPEPNSAEQLTSPADCSSSINLTGVPLPGRADWFFTPPPFCFAAQTQAGEWLSLGIEARPGANRFTEYRYHGQHEAFHLSLAYEGHTQVEGSYALPALAIDFAPDPYTALAMHVQRLREGGLVPTPAGLPRPEWWSEPIFCGWGAQCYQVKAEAAAEAAAVPAGITGRRAPDYATQANYVAYLETLSSNAIDPGTIVLDDKWQRSYGLNDADPDKWPDLPGFIREQHAAGRRVLLWLKAWDPEGLPAEACVTNAAGLPLAVDPSSPDGERILRESVRRMLAEDGYGADGFKIDFTARIPSGPGLHVSGDAWGLELMRLYLAVIHDEARRVKPEAFIITHTPHPYLADLVDAIRLNDINTEYDVVQQMTHRARIAAIACPEALIDTDNWPMPDRASWRAYLQMKPRLGIPALYYAGHFDHTGEPFTEQDYSLLRKAWAGYRETLTANRRAPSETKIAPLGGSFLPVANRLVKRLALSFTLPVTTKPLKAWQAAITTSEEAS